ncbi:MAG: hypothetical protein U0736_15535 [Gemmataceae bacterium]
MWTPKRIVILSAGFVALFMVYLGYGFTEVGRIDGLPPLPGEYWPDPGTNVITPPPRGVSKLEQKIKRAFGPDCKELKRAIRLEVHSRNMILAAEQFKVASDGRVVLAPISVALTGKEKGDGLPPEINTIRGEVAYLTFDRPVSNFSEIASRKIVEAELTGRIEVTSNRRRAERDQDLRVLITSGTLHFREASKKIWTEAYVVVEDHKSKPLPHRIKGKGMEMDLLTEAPPTKPGQRKPGRETISGVKWVMLHSAVEMDLYLEGQGGLMPTGGGLVKGGAKPAPVPNAQAKAAAPASPGKSHLHITTPGRFRYELNKDHDLATFDIAPGTGPTRPSLVPRHVEVVRYNQANNTHDQMVCQHLTLRLKRKEKKEPGPTGRPVAPPPASKGEATDMEAIELETVHAVADAGKNVVLISNTDQLVARGTDFFHDAVKGLTVLKGGPVEVDKDDNRVHAREVRILQVKPADPKDPTGRAYHHIEANGPGDILLVDKKEKRTTRAYWQNLLTSTKDGNQDLLILTGQARFIDEQAEQSLRADVLKVWLDEPDRKQATPRIEPGGDGRRPRHLEATGNVTGRSRDMNIHDTGRMVVWFKDVSPETHLPAGAPAKPAAPPQPAAQVVPGARAVPLAPSGPRPLPAGPEQPAHLTSKVPVVPGAAGPAGAGDNKQPARPFDLTARSVESWVLRSPVKSTIDQLWCEGAVHIKQDPARAEEKGTEVKGDTLRMTAAAADNAYFLVVTGDLAELQTDKIYIIGPEVNIDQSTNKAWVIGDGAMKMESVTNLQGEPLEKSVPLTVHWSKSMLFNGDWAEFHGNIQAVQEKARLACQRLQVYFDKPVSLKQGNKTDQPAKVRNLVCDRDVRVEDSTMQGDRVVKYQRLEGPAVQMMALEAEDAGDGGKGTAGHPAAPVTREAAKPGASAFPAKGRNSAGNVVYASGPGTIRTWEPSNGDDPIGGATPTPPNRTTLQTPAAVPPGGNRSPSAQEMRMTYVAFQKRMDANSKNNTAYFWENVRVLHLPCPRPDAEINLDLILATDLPEKSLYLRCDRLKVLDHPTDGLPNKQMEAVGKVYAQGREFYARADVVRYNQQKQQVIFEGGESGLATLYKVARPGDKPQTVEGKRILYNRATGKIDVIGASSITGETAPPKQ